MKHFDFKTTMWERYSGDDDIVDSILTRLKSKEIDSIDAMNELNEGEYFNSGLLETSLIMNPNENEGQATLEVCDENEEVLWDNKDEAYHKLFIRMLEFNPNLNLPEGQYLVKTKTQNGVQFLQTYVHNNNGKNVVDVSNQIVTHVSTLRVGNIL